MRSALRSIAAVVAGFIAASIVMTIVESINGRVAGGWVTARLAVRAIAGHALA